MTWSGTQRRGRGPLGSDLGVSSGTCKHRPEAQDGTGGKGPTEGKHGGAYRRAKQEGVPEYTIPGFPVTIAERGAASGCALDGEGYVH